MRAFPLSCFAILLLTACSGQQEETAAVASTSTLAAVPTPVVLPLTYPVTATVNQQDDFFGTTVADSFRWLEDDVRVNAEVADWVEQQNALTFSYLDSLAGRDLIKQRLGQLWDFERFTVPLKRGERYFYRRNDGLLNQYVLYVQEALDAEARVLLDPNPWSADGATALAELVPSPDGKYVLYAVQDGGTDWRTLKVLDVDSGTTLEDSIEWVKFSGLAWQPDSSGFYYSRFPEPEQGAQFQSLNFNQALYLHKLGDSQQQDTLVYARPDFPEHSMSGSVVAERFLVIHVAVGTDAAYEIMVKDLSQPEAEIQQLISGFENDYSFIGAQERVLYAVTNRAAPSKRIVAIDLDAPAESNWREIVPESQHVLTGAALIGGKLLVHYLEDVKSAVQVFAMDGSAIGSVALPGLGSAGGFDGEADDSETFYTYSSFNMPATIYRLDLANLTSTEFKRPQLPFDPLDYSVEQVFYASKDGTRIPMFIAHRRDLNRTASTPTLLYGYGGFDVSLTPTFSISNFAWMDMGGIFVMANLRGGGEYGKPWHDAGRLLQKQNVFDDFIAAAEYLIAEGYTSPQQLAIYGSSNGGLLVGAVTNQRPELFAAALPGVGVMDMLRFDKFTAGRYWTDDYGKPSEVAEDFRNNLAYSPYHNIRSGVNYPPVLAITADTDDRVVPGHSFKYMAALQAADTGPAPKLIRIETRAGHGSGKPTEKVIEEYADMWAFLAHHTGLRLPEQYGQ